MADTDKMVLNTDPSAATYRTDIKGWVSRDGIFYGDGPANERTARWAGCTHVHCESCGKPTEKSWLKCRECRSVSDRKAYDAKPKAQWDGKSMLYSELLDEYYSDLETAEDRLRDDQTLEDLMLMICEPNHVRPLDDDYCSDELPDDDHGDSTLPDAVAEAMEAFNKAVAGIVLSWSPGKFALQLPAVDLVPAATSESSGG